MPELTDRERLEEIREYVEPLGKVFSVRMYADTAWLIGQTSAFLSLKERLVSGELWTQFYNDWLKKTGAYHTTQDFIAWLLTYIQKEVK